MKHLLKNAFQNTKANDVNKEEFHKNISSTLTKVSSILRNTYGPYGSNIIIHKGGGDVPIVTKDGLTVLRRIVFEDKANNDILRLISKTSEELVLRVGDGSTSAIIASNEIYHALKEISLEYSSTNDFIRDLEYVQDKLVTIIKNVLSRELPEDNADKRLSILENIATLSNNNDKIIGKKIAEIVSKYTKESSIRIELDPHDNGDIREVATFGFKCNSDYNVHPALLKDGKPIVKHNALVFACYEFGFAQDKIVEAFVRQSEVSMKTKPNVVILAEIWHPELIKKYQFNNLSGVSDNIVPLTVRSITSERQQDFYTDLCTYLNCDPSKFNSFTLEQVESGQELDLEGVVGNARIVKIESNNILFEGGFGNEMQTPKFDHLIKTIQEKLDSLPNAQIGERGRLRLRLERLNGIHCTIYVSGRTNEEKENRKFLVEDSVLACQSVMKHGYTLGGNYAPLYAIITLMNLIDQAADDDTILFDNDKFNDIINELKDIPLERLSMLSEIITALFKAYVNINAPYLPAEYVDFLFDLPINTKLDSKGCLKDVTDEEDSVIVSIYNMKTNEVEDYEETEIIAPVATDIDIMKTSFSNVGLLLSSNLYIF